MIFAEGMDLPKIINELTGLVSAFGVIVLAVIGFIKLLMDRNNNREVKATLATQNDDLATIRVDCENTAKQGREVKQAATEIKQAATEVRIAAVEVAKVVGSPATDSPPGK
jgi:hypothetical protein